MLCFYTDVFKLLLIFKEYMPERIRKVEKRLEENPYDIDSWNTLVRDAQVMHVLFLQS